jgi:nucleoside-diphosphate-sugar epimerase
MSFPARVLILGCGFTGLAVAKLAKTRGQEVLAHARSQARAAELTQLGFDVLYREALDASIAKHVDADTHVVVTFPPDGQTDARVAPALQAAAAVSYVSSTGVYGDHRGLVNDDTPSMPRPNERAARILAAESVYREVGATVLRCPGIYGAERGLHKRIERGEHRIPGDGSRTLSRIHVHDLAALLLASAQVRGETFVVGDLQPAPHLDVVRFICEQRGLAMPPSVPLESVHESLRADRSVDGRRALSRLGVTLAYPTYRAGMSIAATSSDT